MVSSTRLKQFLTLSFLMAFLVLVVQPVWASFKVPQPQGYVTDLAHILSPATTQKITQIAMELDQKTSAQIAVLTVSQLDGTPVEMASLETARTWGIGSKKSGGTGLLIFYAAKDHKLRVEVGYGLEGTITDGTSGEIQDDDMLSAKSYDQGFLQGVAAYAQKIAQADGVTLASLHGNGVLVLPQSQSQNTPQNSGVSALFTLGLFVFLMMIMLSQRFAGSGGVWGGLFTLLALNSLGGLGGGNSGGFGGDDFGGFGGGGFGGGGSTRDW